MTGLLASGFVVAGFVLGYMLEDFIWKYRNWRKRRVWKHAKRIERETIVSRYSS